MDIQLRPSLDIRSAARIARFTSRQGRHFANIHAQSVLKESDTPGISSGSKQKRVARCAAAGGIANLAAYVRRTEYHPQIRKEFDFDVEAHESALDPDFSEH